MHRQLFRRSCFIPELVCIPYSLPLAYLSLCLSAQPEDFRATPKRRMGKVQTKQKLNMFALAAAIRSFHNNQNSAQNHHLQLHSFALIPMFRIEIQIVQ